MDIQEQNKPAQQNGTGFTNLGQYINANQNNQLGNVVGGGVQAAGQAATGAINTAGQQFQTAAGAENNRLNTLGNQAGTAINNATNAGSVSASDINNFSSALSGKGNGPTGLSNVGDLTKQAEGAQAQGAATGSELGRYGLLQNYVGKGQQYGLGQQTLDSALLGQTGQKQLGQARAATANLGGQANQAIASANAQGQQLQNQAKQLASNTQQQLGTAVTGYDKSMADRLSADQAQTSAILGQLGGAPTNAALNFDPTVLSQLSNASSGLLASGTNLYNTDLSPYVTANNTFANKQGVQNQSDFSKIQALSQLAGNTGLAGMSQGDLLNSYLSGSSQVGQYAANSPFSVNSLSGLHDAINNAANNYSGQKGQLDAQLNNTINTGMGGSGVGAQMGLSALQQAATNYQQNGDYYGLAGINPNGVGTGLNQIQPGQPFGTGQGRPTGSPYEVYTQQQARDAIAANNAFQQQLQGNIGQLGKTFDINRILGITPPALHGSPVLGNNGQPLTT